MEYVIEEPSSDKSTLAQLSVETTGQTYCRIIGELEPEFCSPVLEESLGSGEAFRMSASNNLEHRWEEADQLHHTYDETAQLVDIEGCYCSAEQQPQQRSEREQKLLSQIDDLREAESQQRQRIEAATATTLRSSGSQSRHESDLTAGDRAKEEEQQLAQLEVLHATAESQASARATETERLNAEIRTLSQVASEQIDRMDQAKARLAILEQLRIHAETKVCERAEREIRLEAEIDALRQIEASQVQRIEAADEEFRRLTEEQARVQAAAEARQRAEAEVRQRIAAETAQKAADEARRLAEEEEQELERLEAINSKAEAAARERTEKERLLNSQLLAFGEAAAEQLKRINTAEADLSRAEQEFLELQEHAGQTVEQAATRRAEIEMRRQAAADEVAGAQAIGKDEELHLAELDAIRAQAEAEANQRAEVEQQLSADIEAKREAAVQQLKRIETAEADLHRAEEELRQIEAKAREVAEQAATRLAETEMQRQAVANEIAKAEAEEQATTNDVEKHLTELKAIRAQAEAEANQRAEVERQLNAAIEALRQAEATQLRRIEKAQTVAHRMSEKQTELLRIAKEEEQRLVELETARKEFEATSQVRYEEEQRLMAEIEALREIGSEQLARIAEAERALHTKEIELRDPEPEINQQPVEARTGSKGEFVSDEVLDLRFENTETIKAESSTEPSQKLDGSVVPNASFQAARHETPLVNSLAKRLSSGDQEEFDSVVEELRRLEDNAAFDLITPLFDDGAEAVRNAAARALFDLGKERTDFFTKALREASPDRTGQIARALEASGLASKAIDNLVGQSREQTNDAFSLLFFMAKAGEVQTLFHTIEKHSNVHVRLSVIKLLTFTNRPDTIPALRSLAVRGALPIEVRSALMNSIYEMSSGNRERSRSAA